MQRIFIDNHDRIRMMQLGLLKRNDLSDPYRLVRVEMDEEDRML